VTEVELEQLLEAAKRHHRAGRIAPAIAAYEEIIRHQPRNDEALHMLGVAYLQSGNVNRAVELIERAVAIDSSDAEYFNNLAEAYRRAGRLEKSAESARRAIALSSEFAQAYSNLGFVLREMGKLSEAVAACKRAVELRPGFSEAHDSLARVYHAMGRQNDSIASFRRAVQCKPDEPVTHNNLAGALASAGQVEDAISEYRLALRLWPGFAEAHNNLGCALADQNLPEAISEFEQAIKLRPNYPEAFNNLSIALLQDGKLEPALAAAQTSLQQRPDFVAALNNLGIALNYLGRTEESLKTLRRALELNPKFAETHCNLGISLTDAGRNNEAIVACSEAIRLRPNFPQAHLNIAICRLRKGEMQKAWPDYEWRLKTKSPVPFRAFVQPQWAGEALTGKTILVHADGGFGDAIQFVRYAPMIAQRGGRVILECQPELARLFQGITGIEEILTRGQKFPPFDLHCPLMSLPRAFATDLNSIPATGRYLALDSDLQRTWADRLGSPGARRRIGLRWSGKQNFHKLRNPSIPPQELTPLTQTKDAIFYALQPPEPPSLNLVDFSPQLTDFAQTAALIAHLDLVITIDTAVAHLAGALAKPVWLMLPKAADWRWLLNRSDSPWYPTMRLFRQPEFGDWASVVRNISETLPTDWKITTDSVT
jgi:Flp pilus assembly protein TadD